MYFAVAPVWRATACAIRGLTDRSGNTAFTSSLRITRLRSASSPADGCAWVVCDGITAPTTSIP